MSDGDLVARLLCDAVGRAQTLYVNICGSEGREWKVD